MSRLFQILRFGMVGVINTAVDIGLYVLLRNAGAPLIVANAVSTTVALGVSYLLNFRFTFKSDHSRSRLVWFLLITCGGLWILHPVVITAVTRLDTVFPVLEFVYSLTKNHDLAYDAAPKLAATGVTLVWNYLWYSQKIFARGHESKPQADAADSSA